MKIFPRSVTKCLRWIYNKDISLACPSKASRRRRRQFHILSDEIWRHRACWRSVAFSRYLVMGCYFCFILWNEILLMIIIIRSQYGIRRKGLLGPMDIRFYENHSFLIFYDSFFSSKKWIERRKIYSRCLTHRTNQLSQSGFVWAFFLYRLKCILKRFYSFGKNGFRKWSFFN